ncbi:MAG: UvrD-helicase domain-containing protein [Cyanobacteria bacterium RUI128]|nr:UvrD-helicase domain-containing protein [Cyanobacteria bacterium RUI128]
MIINKISDKNNSKLIAEKYVEWLDIKMPEEVKPSEILVLTFNSNSKKNIVKNILKLSKKNVISDIKIYTFNGLIYNTILDNWGILENKITKPTNLINPNLSGLEISQYLLKQIVKEEEVKGYNSKKSLLHQIFRRYSLIVNNNLSPKDVEKKSQILGEAFGEDAARIINRFKSKTIDLRTFDYIRQAQIFSHIFKNTDYFKNIKYLIVEDADELTPLAYDFIESIKPQLKESLILTDKNGGSRCGYLCADGDFVRRLENIFNEKIEDVQENKNILALRENILNSDKQPLDNLSVYSVSKRVDMLEKALEVINELLGKGIKPNEISVITPVQDRILKHIFKSELKNAYPLFISGNEKLADNPLIKTVITVLKLSENKVVDEYEIRVILSKYLGIPVKICKTIFDNYKQENTLLPADLGCYTNSYTDFLNMLEELKRKDLPLSEKAFFVYSNFIKKVNKYDLAKFNFFMKELQDFEKVFENNKPDSFEEEVLNQIENSIISENPYMTLDTGDKDLIISTPQKIIDNKIKTKYQVWLDTSSQEWIITDIGPLYNSWVFQKSWEKESYTIEDNIRLSREKTCKTLRKLCLNTEKIVAFSSLFDAQGVENFGGIEQYLIPLNYENEKEDKKSFQIIPRDDQKPVLEYEKGRMAISAVPGAGKTTILLALIVKLMNSGINPENIYVLTYMESAARNFKDRIKNIDPDSTKMPNISTIHGLALKILKENSNFERLGLNSDFDICDDTQRGNLLHSLIHLANDDLEDFDRAISVFKLGGGTSENIDTTRIKKLLNLTKGSAGDMKLARFLKFFYSYQEKLKQNNLIDYDDILLSSVRLLEENRDILEYYQEICEYIIEDEAQDSSSVQQRLINLLSAKHNNLIRCGDINQAITTTFTNADVDGFKEFIENSNRVDMNRSQRCTKGVWKLANSLVKFGNSKLKTPFYEIYMNPVEGKNPEETNPIHADIYDSLPDEKVNTMRTIKTLFDKKPDCTIGVLLRNNYQVNKWAEYLNSAGLTAITRNECLGQKKIFKVIFSVLRFISNPFNNSITADAYSALSQIGILKPHLDKIIENYDEDFISLDNDEISDSDLARFHWDMNYWLSFPELSIDELALMIGMHYFSESLDKSNICLISTLCARLNSDSFNQTVQRLEELSNRPNLSGFKFFSEDEEENMTGGKIQIMTLHKSKGDEFDYVFLPEMSEKNLTLDISKLQLKKSSDFMENIRELNKNYKRKTDSEMKLFLVSENYRLLYVAITRAKRRLYISSHATELYYGKEKDVTPSIIFDELINHII